MSYYKIDVQVEGVTEATDAVERLTAAMSGLNSALIEIDIQASRAVKAVRKLSHAFRPSLLERIKKWLRGIRGDERP